MQLEAELGQSGQKLVLLPVVVAHLLSYQQRKPRSFEAGGQLFGRQQGQAILVEVATGPRPSDRRSRYSYRPDRRLEQVEIDEKFASGFRFLGDWHSHPEPVPKPSTTDIPSMQDCFRRSRHELHAFVLLIIGVSELPLALHGSLHGSHEMLDLRFQIKTSVGLATSLSDNGSHAKESED